MFDNRNGHYLYSNDLKGFRLFAKSLQDLSCCVMEATGSYHHRLAVFLFEHQIGVAVINPLVIKRFIQMKLRRTKTDKSDAQMIFSYAQEQPVLVLHASLLH